MRSRSGFRAPHLGALMVALTGVGNGITQLRWTRSLSLAPPSAVVPFNYLSLVWAAILGFAVWGDVPTASLLVGSAIVVASGLYILWRETLRRRPERPSSPASVVRSRSFSIPGVWHQSGARRRAYEDYRDCAD